jgi:cytochrome c oxidase assembly protein subunit 11
MKRRDGLVLGALVGITAGMIALTFAAVPFYTIFCRATGFGGTTQRVTEAAGKTVDRTIEIRFDTQVDRGLPWRFKPNQRAVTLRIGETGMATFHASNTSGAPVVGTAVFNVTPEKAGLYFDKIQCFCFTQQVLGPGESADLPVAFYIDPAIVKDHNLDDVSVITLSYTFYRAQSQALDTAIGDAGRAAETETIERAVGAGPGSKASLNAASAPPALAAGARVE